MFPQEGETVPKVRFKGFEGEWDFVTAGEVFRTTNVRNRPDLPVLSATQDKGMVKRSDIGYQVFHDKSNETTYKHILPGQFIISPAYKVYEIVNISPLFLQQWIKMDSTKVFFLNATTAGASLCRKNIVWDDLYKQIVLIPSKNEQVKIGLFFSNLDKQISLQTQRLEKLKQIKAACLDKMFV